jgi:hypothetical protein
MFYLYAHYCHKPLLYKRQWRLIDVPGFYSYENATEALRLHCLNTGKSFDDFRIVYHLDGDILPLFVDSIYFTDARQSKFN